MPSKRIIPINIKVYLLTKHCFKYYLWVTFISNCILNICELIVSFFYIYEKRIYGWFKVYKLIGLYYILKANILRLYIIIMLHLEFKLNEVVTSLLHLNIPKSHKIKFLYSALKALVYILTNKM